MSTVEPHLKIKLTPLKCTDDVYGLEVTLSQVRFMGKEWMMVAVEVKNVEIDG